MSKTFYILDGHAQIFRAFFAPFRELNSPTGEPTKATYVFTQMLLNLLNQRRPEYLAMVIDSGEKDVFRTAIYPEYKANRPPPPPEFFPQEKRIIQIVRDAGVPLFVLPGYEADDIIATLVTKVRAEDVDVVLISKDKDLRQLLSPRVRMYDPQNDSTFDMQSLMDDWGVTPEQCVELQALMGDKIDNVPGIPGVGEKTAAELIKQFGTAAEVYARAGEIKKPKLRENVQTFGDKIALSRMLVALKCDLEVDFDLEGCAFRGVNKQAIAKHLNELGFQSMQRKLDGIPSLDGQAEPEKKPAPKLAFAEDLFASLEPAQPAQAPAAPPPLTSAECDYRMVDTPEKLAGLVAALQQQPIFAFDTETDALGAMNSNLIGMSFSFAPTTGWYVPVRGPIGSTHLSPEQALAALKPILEDPQIKKVGHNIKYDLLVMRNAGVTLRGIAMDTMVAAFVLDSSRMQYGIDRLALDLLNIRKIATSELIGKGPSQVSMSRLPLEQVTRYAAEDADVCFRLYQLMRRELDELPALAKLCDDLETPLVEVLAEMEFNGVAIDNAMLREQSAVLGARAEELHKQVQEAAGMPFNPDSPRQLADLLFDKLGLKVIKRNKTGPSTDVEVLERLADVHPVPKLILEYRGLVKLKNTYLDNLPEYVNERTGRIHGSFNQTGAATGRLSMSDPNLQNIPIRTDEGRRIRLAFVAGGEGNVLLIADYSQIELRVLAHYTQEPALLRAFENDEDIHAAVAAEVFHVPLKEVTKDQRAQAKVINFGIIYGVTPQGLARRIDGMSVQGAKELIASYNNRFPSIQRFLQQCVMDAQGRGYVETILGRRRKLPEIHSPVIAQRNAGERQAINSVVQGSAADLIKVAMLNIHRKLAERKSPSRMLLQVHDELVFETPSAIVEEEAKWITHEMTSAMKLRVPLKAEVGWGRNWQEGK